MSAITHFLSSLWSHNPTYYLVEQQVRVSRVLTTTVNQGNGVNVLKIMPESAAKFVANERLSSAIARDTKHMEAYERFIAGG